MRIAVLGVVSLDTGAGLRPVAGRTPAAVLAHLTLAGGRQLSVDQLAQRVWDEPPESARNAVQVAVSHIRKAFGHDVVGSGRTGYWVRTDLATVDWTEATELGLAADQSLIAGDHQQAVASATAGLALFRGDPLAGLESSAARLAREAGESLRDRLQLVLGRSLLESGRESEAVDAAQALIERDPLNEPAHALLIEALAAGGKTAEAVNRFHVIRTLLADELGVDPSRQLSELFTAVLHNKVTGRQPAERSLTPEPRGTTANIPRPATPLIGRDQVRKDVNDLLATGHRLVTIHGPGGVGKTRLALAVAEDQSSEQNVAFVELAGAQESTIAATLLSGIGAAGETVDDVRAALGQRLFLLVLDNAETVIEPLVDVVAQLLRSSNVHLLVTSQVALRVRDETVVAVEPLVATGPGSPAVLLLADRANLPPDEDPATSAALSRLAERTDGVPLVIELVAGALRWQSPEQLLADYDQTLMSAVDTRRDRPHRHTSIDSTLAWSLSRTTPVVRDGLNALTVFRSAFSLPAAMEILSQTLTVGEPRSILVDLLDLALLQRSSGPGGVRFRMLEPIRIAVSRADAPAAARRAHAEYFAAALDRADADTESVDYEAVERLVVAQDADLNDALHWAWLNAPDLAVELLGPLLYGWYRLERDTAVRAWSARVSGSAAGTPLARAKVQLINLSSEVYTLSGTAAEWEAGAAGLHALAESLPGDWHRRWIHARYHAAMYAGDIPAALRWTDHYRRGPAGQLGEREQMSRADVLWHSGDHLSYLEQVRAMTSAPSASMGARLRGEWLVTAVYRAAVTGELDLARLLYQQAATLCQEENTPNLVGQLMVNLAWIHVRSDDYRSAAEVLETKATVIPMLTDGGVICEFALIGAIVAVAFGHISIGRRLAQEVWLRVTVHPLAIDAFGREQLELILTEAEAGEMSVAVPTSQDQLAALVVEGVARPGAEGQVSAR